MKTKRKKKKLIIYLSQTNRQQTEASARENIAHFFFPLRSNTFCLHIDDWIYPAHSVGYFISEYGFTTELREAEFLMRFLCTIWTRLCEIWSLLAACSLEIHIRSLVLDRMDGRRNMSGTFLRQTNDDYDKFNESDSKWTCKLENKISLNA